MMRKGRTTPPCTAKAKPSPEAEHGEVRRPLHLGAVAAEPEEERGTQRARRARDEGQEQDPILVIQPVAASSIHRSAITAPA
jgi:hypothetical protein